MLMTYVHLFLEWELGHVKYILNFLKYKFIYFNWRLITLQYCIVLPYIDRNQPWVYMCSLSWTPLPPPSPYHPSGSSQCTSPKLPVSCIEPGLAIHFLYDIIHVSMPFWLVCVCWRRGNGRGQVTITFFSQKKTNQMVIKSKEKT